MEGNVNTTADGGTGQKLTHATIVVAGVASLVATALSVMYGFLPPLNASRQVPDHRQFDTTTSKEL